MIEITDLREGLLVGVWCIFTLIGFYVAIKWVWKRLHYHWCILNGVSDNTHSTQEKVKG